jgi:hypothetical protein
MECVIYVALTGIGTFIGYTLSDLLEAAIWAWINRKEDHHG